MQQLTQEWVEKAEGDWHAALRDYRARKHPGYDEACYHTQQCAEKYLKARLEEATLAVPRTHDLMLLLRLVLQVEQQWIVIQPQVNALNAYAVAFRYPGKSATKAQAKQAVKDCRVIRLVIRTAFGLPI